jgi:hypothetical protein
MRSESESKKSMVDQFQIESPGYYSGSVELVGGPFDGLEIHLDPALNARFFMQCDDGKKAWYQYGIIGYCGRALYITTS